MDNRKIFSFVDHTLLKPYATWRQIERLAKEAEHYGAASVCIPPSYVKQVRSNFPELNITTVVGFPLGYSSTGTKIYEAFQAVNSGANEIDMVINICDVKKKKYNYIFEEIFQMKKNIGNNILKVIVETCYLEKKEKIDLCDIVESSGADFIKTSTGFGDAGAQLDDIKLFKNHITNKLRIKAAGGIRTKEQMILFLEAGADRLGCSTGITALFS